RAAARSRNQTPLRAAVAAAPPCLRRQGPGGQPPFLRGHARPAAGRDLVRADLSPACRARGPLLPHLLRLGRWRSPRLLPAPPCRRLGDRTRDPSARRRLVACPPESLDGA